jgi:rSAM/selenodomain-associated transferase 1
MELDRLIILVRAPVPGQVKSRLASGLGPTAACEAYRTMVETLLSNLAGLSSVELCFTPAHARPLISGWLQKHWTASPQCEGDLGTRMMDAFNRAFDSGARRAVLIGSDTPEANADDVRAAWAALDCSDVVLGPALDGGYWLIALRQLVPSLFTAVRWGGDSVLAETTRRAQLAGLRLSLLRTLADVDQPEDWRAYLARCASKQG